MTDPAPAVDAPSTESAPPTRSDEALARYGAAMRRKRGVYFAVIGVVVVVLAIVVSVAWSRGEVANTTLHTVAKAPKSLSAGTPATKLTVSWRTGDRAALGLPQWGGTVVTYSTHTVHGVDARTGASTWSYTRSNRTVCTAAQLAGTTIAVYEVNGNCDELTALDSQTGKRRWTRTLAFDGRPLNGQASYQVLPFTFMMTSKSVIYAIDPVSGYNRFTYTRYGCTIEHAVLGSAGALISQTCTKPVCAKQKFCARGPQLLLRDGSNDRDDKSTTNPDRIMWNHIGNTDVPVTAGALISAVNTTTRALDTFDSEHGTSLGTVQLTPAPTALDRIAVAATDTTELIWIGDRTYAVTSGHVTADWTTATPGPPTITSDGNDDPPPLSQATITVPTSTGFRLLSAEGRTTASIDLPGAPTGGAVYPLGTGALVASGAGTVAYR